MGGLHAGSDADLHFQARFEQSHLPQAITGLDLRLIMVNAATSRLLGRPVDELIGMHVDTLTHPDAAASRARELLDGDASGMLEYERVYQRPDGRGVPVRLFATLVRDPSGAPQNIAAFLVDLTDQKHAEEALRSRERCSRLSWSGPPTWPSSTRRTGPSCTRTPPSPASATPRTRCSASRVSTSSIPRTGTSWRQPSRRCRGGRRRPCHWSTGTTTPTAGSAGSKRG